MKVGLIDVDGHNYPNLPLMKISAYHKARGDTVEWYEPLISDHMDKVYMSKVFSFTSEKKNYFFCMKKTREDCQEDIFGKPNCNFCEHKDNCKNCGRKDTSFCEKCEVKDE